jgi:isoleucyl-tRNA synthetase
MKGLPRVAQSGLGHARTTVEIEVEKQLGISGKQQIEALGVAEFNRLCRESVFKYRSDWEQLSARMGVLARLRPPVRHVHNDYVESVWWALKTLFDKDLLYRGTRSCRIARGAERRCRATKSRSGTRTSKTRASTSRSSCADDGGIPACATHPRVDDDAVDARVERRARGASGPRLRRGVREGRTRIRERSSLPSRASSRCSARTTRRVEHRAALQGRDWSGSATRAARLARVSRRDEHEIIVGEDFVSADDGSGVVHMSPAFGADDYAAGSATTGVPAAGGARGEFPRRCRSSAGCS